MVSILVPLVAALLILVSPSSAAATTTGIYLVARDETSTGIKNASGLATMIQPGYNLGEAADDSCGEIHPNRRVLLQESMKASLKMELKHRDHQATKTKSSLLLESLKRDTARRQAFQRRVSQKVMASSNPAVQVYARNSSSKRVPWDPKEEEVESTVESGAELGAGEYFMDVFVGTPPRHFLLIIDTGSDLTWLQCKPCKDCFNQSGPIFDPSQSTSFKNIPCKSPACDLVSHEACHQSPSSSPPSCKYFYSYGDSSQTSGDLARESLSVNLSGHSSSLEIQDLVVGCGHSNKGLFQGAGGLLGLGQGSLSFPSQLRSSPIGHSFSYCLVDRSSNLSVSSAISFGDAFSLSRHFESKMQFTPFLRSNNSVETFYYLGIRGIKINQDLLPIPEGRFAIAGDGSGGTIIDSGTTLTYLEREAYKVVESSFVAKITYPKADPFDILGLCYNATGTVRFPTMAIVFHNGVELDLPQKNYFIQPDPEQEAAKHCLAILPTTGMSIIGNFQQQNIHFLYDVQNSRLGFAKTDCSKL